MPACQSSSGTRVTAWSGAASGAGGWVARAAAAASSIGSGPLIRVVLRVATSGKPRTPTGARCALSVATAIVTIRVSPVPPDENGFVAIAQITRAAASTPPPAMARTRGSRFPIGSERTQSIAFCSGRGRRTAANATQNASTFLLSGRQTTTDREGRGPCSGKWQVPLPVSVNWLTDQSINPGSTARRPPEWTSPSTTSSGSTRSTCRKFAREVIRPVAPQARRRGEHSLGGHQGGPQAGPAGPRAHAADGRGPRRAAAGDLRRGAPLGLRRHRAGDLGLRPRRRRHRRLRHARADRRLGPRVLRRRRRDQARRLRRHRAAGRLRRQEPAHHRQARRRRVGPQRHQGLHHQRRHRRRPRRRRHRRPGARPPRPGLVRRRQGHARACARARRSRSSASAPRTPPRSSSRTAGSRSRTCSAAMEKLERKLERARSGQTSARSSNALATFEITRPIVGASALGIAQAAYEWTLEYLDGDQTVETAAGRRCERAARSSRCSPTSRPRSRPRACWSSAPPGWAATASR